jgi:MFS family permease
MTSDGVAASSTAERDVRKTNAGHEIRPGEIATGVIIGRTSEFFDFFVYAIASVLVFPKLVFPYMPPVTATVYSFAIFSLAFLARPFGTFIFMAVDRRHGRGAKLTASIFLLGTSTVAIAFLPGYAQIGWGSALFLALFRIGQGAALGGTWDGLPSLLSLYAPHERRGWYAMIPQLGAPLGLMVASSLFAFFEKNLSNADFIDWGWRYPFFVAFAINVVALFARLRIVVTPQYAHAFESRELEPAPIRATIASEGWNILIGAFAPLATFSLFHMVTVFPLSWVFLFTHQPPLRFLSIEAFCSIIGVLAIAASGLIADRVGRRTLLVLSACAIAAFSGFAPQLLDGGDLGETIYMAIGFLLLGLSFGQASGTIAFKFSKTYRYTASAITSDLAWLLGAGFAPCAALLLASRFGLVASGLYLLSGAICTLLALLISRHTEEDKPKLFGI